jgi:hypothetical protein
VREEFTICDLRFAINQPTTQNIMIKLGSKVTDIATGLKGMVTNLQIEMDGQRFVRFQPRSLNPETGEPVKGMWVVEARLKGGEIVEEPELPRGVLGTEVEDEATGFCGIATSICLHISGCVHVSVQPPLERQSD